VAVELAWDLGRQRDAVLEWLGRNGAEVARAATRRHGLASDLAGDVANDAWIRAHQTFHKRDSPYEGMTDDVAVERYARRVVDNAAIDRARLASNRREVATVDHRDSEDSGPALDDLAAAVDGAFDAVTSTSSMLELRDTVGELALTGGERCPGCHEAIVAATALRVANLLATGAEVDSDAGAGWLDALIYDSLQHTDVETFAEVGPRLTDKQRQKKSRCGRCIQELLRRAARLIGLDR
jgi:DNA-directed RNA polymerase specialized sigma24 family protein